MKTLFTAVAITTGAFALTACNTTRDDAAITTPEHSELCKQRGFLVGTLNHRNCMRRLAEGVPAV